MLRQKNLVVGAGILALLLGGRTLAHQPANPAEPGRELVFEVQGLTCCAVDGLGWGSLLAPVLARLDEIDGVERSYANRTGMLLRVSVATKADPDAVAGEVHEVLKVGHGHVSRLAGTKLSQVLQKEEWRDVGRVGELSRIEFRTLALRLLPWLAGVLAAIGVVAFLKRGVMHPLHTASACLVIALGVVHAARTPWVVDGCKDEAVWFAGSGLALVLLGFLNVILAKDVVGDRIVGLLAHTANLTGTLFVALVAAASTKLPELVGLLLLLVLTTTALLRPRRNPVRHAPAAVAVTGGGHASP